MTHCVQRSTVLSFKDLFPCLIRYYWNIHSKCTRTCEIICLEVTGGVGVDGEVEGVGSGDWCVTKLGYTGNCTAYLDYFPFIYRQM